jgi:hypothetical protein
VTKKRLAARSDPGLTDEVTVRTGFAIRRCKTLSLPESENFRSFLYIYDRIQVFRGSRDCRADKASQPPGTGNNTEVPSSLGRRIHRRNSRDDQPLVGGILSC